MKQMNEETIWRLHCQMIDLGNVDVIPPEWMETPTKEEEEAAIELFVAHQDKKKVLDKQYAFVHQLEIDIANLCMGFEKTTGAYISGLNFNRQMKHVWYGEDFDNAEKGNPKIIRVQVQAPSEYLVTPYEWNENNE